MRYSLWKEPYTGTLAPGDRDYPIIWIFGQKLLFDNKGKEPAPGDGVGWVINYRNMQVGLLE